MTTAEKYLAAINCLLSEITEMSIEARQPASAMIWTTSCRVHARIQH